MIKEWSRAINVNVDKRKDDIMTTKTKQNAVVHEKEMPAKKRKTKTAKINETIQILSGCFKNNERLRFSYQWSSNC